jgi:hypothetical protein
MPGNSDTACGLTGLCAVCNLDAGEHCVDGGCIACSTSWCVGCCDPAGYCQPGTSALACGFGISCVTCQTGYFCDSTRTCSPSTCGLCAGCCDAEPACLSPNDSACGSNGSLCTPCPTGFACALAPGGFACQLVPDGGLDAGPPDAGSLDGGALLDGGSPDGGAGAADGGGELPIAYLGCRCSSNGAAVIVWLACLAAALRRRKTRRET